MVILGRRFLKVLMGPNAKVKLRYVDWSAGEREVAAS